METNQNPSEEVQVPEPPKTQEQMLQEIYENTRKTKNYMMWQLYITLVLVVLPLLAALIIVPFVMKSLTATYSGLLQ